MWAIARYDLHLTDEEFYSLTPRQFDALLKRHELAEQKREYLAAQTTAAIINFSMRAPDKPVSPRDFMLSLPPERKQKPTKKQIKKVAQNLRALFKG